MIHIQGKFIEITIIIVHAGVHLLPGPLDRYPEGLNEERVSCEISIA